MRQLNTNDKISTGQSTDIGLMPSDLSAVISFELDMPPVDHAGRQQDRRRHGVAQGVGQDERNDLHDLRRFEPLLVGLAHESDENEHQRQHRQRDAEDLEQFEQRYSGESCRMGAVVSSTLPAGVKGSC